MVAISMPMARSMAVYEGERMAALYVAHMLQAEAGALRRSGEPCYCVAQWNCAS